jgi:hypothetical protein
VGKQNHEGVPMHCIVKLAFELGGDLTLKEGEEKTHVADVLTDKETFKVIGQALDGATKMMALNTPKIMKGCFGSQECINNILVKCQQEETKQKGQEKISCQRWL